MSPSSPDAVSSGALPRRTRFSLKAVLILLAVAAVLLTPAAMRRQRVHKVAAAVRALRDLGGNVLIVDSSTNKVMPPLHDFTDKCLVTEVYIASNLNLVDADLRPLSAFANLRQLDLQVCPNITDAGFLNIGSVREIEIASLGTTKIGDPTLCRLADATHLEALYVGNTRITDDGLRYLAALPTLEVIDAEHTSVSDARIIHLQSLPLRRLNLRYTKITDESLSRIAALPNLEALDLTRTGVTSAGLQHLSPLTHLRVLNIEGCKLDAGLLLATHVLHQLTELRLGCSALNDSALARISNATNLTTLDLNRTQISDDGVVALARMTHLMELNLSDTEIGDDSLATIDQLPNLKILNLSGTRVTNAGLSHLGRLPELTRLDLTGDAIGDEGVYHLRSLTKLLSPRS